MHGHSHRPRLAILSWSSALYDSRTERLARSALAAGYDVVVYARRDPGTAETTQHDGFRVVRVAVDWRRGLRLVLGRGQLTSVPTPPSVAGPVPSARAGRVRRVLGSIARLPGIRALVGGIELALTFPVRPLAWAAALDEVAEPADLWHGMWAGSLPALERLRRRHGGRTVYDSRDVFLLSRGYARLPGFLVAPFRRLERRWARGADAVVTVNDGYARLLAETLRVTVAAVVRNCPERYVPPVPAPDRIRAALGLPPSTPVVLYQGRLATERGIEQAIEAIRDVPDAVLVLLGFGRLRGGLESAAQADPHGRVRLIDAVPPADLLDWTASADVMVMPIQPTTVNHRFTTPNKLWEAIAAGTPVVAGDLPGMAEVIRETGAGVLCDPTSPASIAAAIRTLLDLPEDQRTAMRGRALDAARERYNWDAQVRPLLDLYGRLVERPPEAAPQAAPSRS
jgi:glycosyltransferase involved in cell wall biosynthesis